MHGIVAQFDETLVGVTLVVLGQLILLAHIASHMVSFHLFITGRYIQNIICAREVPA